MGHALSWISARVSCPGVREIGSLTIKFRSRVPHWEPKLARLFAHAAHKVSHFFPETCETSGKYARK